MHLTIDHTTTYRFDEPVPWGLQRVRLRPITTVMQEVMSWTLDIQGATRELNFSDQYMNEVDLLSFASSTEVQIRAHGVVVTKSNDGIFPEPVSKVPLWMLARPTPLTETGQAVKDLTAQFGPNAVPDPNTFHAISKAIVDQVPWTEGATNSTTSAEQALVGGAGVCQDHAHIFLAVARELGFAGRYVSGYLMMNDRIHQPAMHAWAEVWVDGLGFVGFDVSNGISPDERYVRIAVGLDYREAAPIAGTRYGAGNEFLDVSLSVTAGNQ